MTAKKEEPTSPIRGLNQQGHALFDFKNPEGHSCCRPTQKGFADERLRLSMEKVRMPA